MTVLTCIHPGCDKPAPTPPQQWELDWAADFMDELSGEDRAILALASEAEAALDD